LPRPSPLTTKTIHHGKTCQLIQRSKRTCSGSVGNLVSIADAPVYNNPASNSRKQIFPGAFLPDDVSTGKQLVYLTSVIFTFSRTTPGKLLFLSDLSQPGWPQEAVAPSHLRNKHTHRSGTPPHPSGPPYPKAEPVSVSAPKKLGQGRAAEDQRVLTTTALAGYEGEEEGKKGDGREEHRRRNRE
jgi:hypothetical protein